MEEVKTIVEDSESPFKNKYSLAIFVTVSIMLAISLVVISLAIYNNSGAAQLDLSRPGYVSVRSQANNDNGSLLIFSSSGSVNKKIIDEFKEIYDTQAIKTKSANAFGGDPLSPISLGMEVPADSDVIVQ